MAVSLMSSKANVSLDVTKKYQRCLSSMEWYKGYYKLPLSWHPKGGVLCISPVIIPLTIMIFKKIVLHAIFFALPHRDQCHNLQPIDWAEGSFACKLPIYVVRYNEFLKCCSKPRKEYIPFGLIKKLRKRARANMDPRQTNTA